MNANFLRMAAFAALIFVSNGVMANDGPGDWKVLLDGGDWTKHWTSNGNWTSGEDGSVTLTPRAGESGWTRYGAYLWSHDEYDNFEVEFDYKLQKSGNSGFYFNVSDKANPVAKGIEVQIYDSGSRGADHKLSDHDSGGVIPGIAPLKNAAKPAGEWNQFNITVQGDKLVIKLNGELVNEVTLNEGRLKGRPESGFIGFQDHGLPLSLKNIRIRSLPAEAIK